MNCSQGSGAAVGRSWIRQNSAERSAQELNSGESSYKRSLFGERLATAVGVLEKNENSTVEAWKLGLIRLCSEGLDR
jgi:ribosomal protein L29